MLNLIQTELLKLRRKKTIWLMLCTSFFMQPVSIVYARKYLGAPTDPSRTAIAFYKWNAFSYTPWIILPVVLGILCALLMYEDSQHDTLKQLWIVPVSRSGYFFSKFAVMLLYSICFMLLTAAASLLSGVLTGYASLAISSIRYLFVKCLEIALLTAFAMLPILAVSAMQKGYILPVCAALLYTFLGFILLMGNMYLHPLSSMAAIIMRNIPGVIYRQPLNLPAAFLCILLWGAGSSLIAVAALKKRS